MEQAPLPKGSGRSSLPPTLGSWYARYLRVGLACVIASVVVYRNFAHGVSSQSIDAVVRTSGEKGHVMSSGNGITGSSSVDRIAGEDPCGPQDATSEPREGFPDIFWGWSWTGVTCVAVYGWVCEGVDCGEVSLHQMNWASCMGRHSNCCPLPSPTSTSPGSTPEATSPGIQNDFSIVDQFPDTPTPTLTATPLPTGACECWPQDIVGVIPTESCEDPTEIFGYRHIGYGVCEAVAGCDFDGVDAADIFDTMDSCLEFYGDCVCEECDPMPTPIAIPTATVMAVCDNCPPGSEYLDRHEWYPVDRGQKPGERAMNWWSTPANFCLFGQSTYNYDGIPKGFPAEFGQQCVDYYFNWACLEEDDPDCNDYEKYLEIISERTNDAGQAIYLDLWGHGPKNRWRTFYDPNLLGDGSSCACNDQTVEGMSAEDKKNAKVPVSFIMPCEPGADWAYSNVVCSAIYTGEDGGEGGWDEEDLGVRGNNEDPTSLYFVRSKLLEYLHDPDEQCNIALLVNEYFTTSCAQVEDECDDDPAWEDARCEEVVALLPDRRARRFTFTLGERPLECCPGFQLQVLRLRLLQPPHVMDAKILGACPCARNITCGTFHQRVRSPGENIAPLAVLLGSAG